MWNPFRNEHEHSGFFEAAIALATALEDLREDIKELREEVDYLAEFLDD